MFYDFLPGCRKSILLFFSALLIALSWSSMAQSNPEYKRICKKYANKAVQQQQQNKRQNCGFKGPRWSADYWYHYNWCYVKQTHGGHIRQLDHETWERRNNLVHRCKAKGAKAMLFCQDYANSAVSQNRQNLQRSCREGGPRWSSDYWHHYNWCFVVITHHKDYNRVNSERRARARSLRKFCP